ncbi:MAG: M15 family metallopeptidase [Parcubacteria group bacterium]
MKTDIYNKLNNWQIALIGVVVLFILAAGGAYWKYRGLTEELEIERGENVELAVELEGSKQETLDLLELSNYQREVIDSFQEQIQSLGSTVGMLDKLAKTDKELLRKYSKVYFLNENYVPAKLTEIEENYQFKEGENFLFHADVWPYLKRLLDAARASGLGLEVASAFRSFDTQASLKVGYKVTYGAGTANQFSADQGYSEHQLGTSVDFTTPAVGGTFSKFEADPGYQWLIDNAHKYGFVLSYPKGNAYYVFEPWHWRFVGVSLAEMLHQRGQYFYDLDQREIDGYLIRLFE